MSTSPPKAKVKAKVKARTSAKPKAAITKAAVPARRRATPKARSRAVEALADTMDADFFKAVGEPVRQQIVVILLQQGRSNIQQVAAQMAQDRSVVSRHLSSLARAGLVRAHRVQRFTEYELDGPTIIDKLERLLARFRAAAQLCCPPA